MPIGSLVIHDLLGGELLIAEVSRGDGSSEGVHYWNLLPDGAEVDLTRGQFSADEIVQTPRGVRRPAGLPKRGAEQYLTLRAGCSTQLAFLATASPVNPVALLLRWVRGGRL